MLLKGIVDEDFVNYKVPSMFISMNTCSFKCDIDCGEPVCQNRALASQPSVDMDIDDIILRYLHNPITQAIVFGGLEPFDQLADLYDFIYKLRFEHHCQDCVVIYTGYDETEIFGKLVALEHFPNIIVKFGRYIPGGSPHFDPTLGVKLSSDNQYARQIT